MANYSHFSLTIVIICSLAVIGHCDIDIFHRDNTGYGRSRHREIDVVIPGHDIMLDRSGIGHEVDDPDIVESGQVS